jgi:hypothetical protein
MTDEFLSFSQAMGNDLSTPRPEYNFPGLKDGDCWCLCAARWQEALEAGIAPKVKLGRLRRVRPRRGKTRRSAGTSNRRRVGGPTFTSIWRRILFASAWKQKLPLLIQKALFICLVRRLISFRFSIKSAKVCKKSIAVIAFFHQKQTILLDGY